MLYAHFEGFTSFCWELVLDQIQARRISVAALNGHFRTLALEKTFRELKADLSADALWAFSNTKLPALLKSDAEFSEDCRLSAENNLWPNVFERECAKVEIKSRELDAQRARIGVLEGEIYMASERDPLIRERDPNAPVPSPFPANNVIS